MKVPRDQGLFFTAFFVVYSAIVFTAWVLLPVYHEEEQEVREASAASMDFILPPEELIRKSERIIKTAETALSGLESAQDKKSKSKSSKRR